MNARLQQQFDRAQRQYERREPDDAQWEELMASKLEREYEKADHRRDEEIDKQLRRQHND